MWEKGCWYVYQGQNISEAGRAECERMFDKAQEYKIEIIED